LATSNFALRIAPELKDAAKALTKIYVWKDGVSILSPGSSINDVFSFLIRRGLADIEPMIAANLADETANLEIQKTLAMWLITNSTASHVVADDLEKGTPARVYLEKIAAEVEDADLGYDCGSYRGEDRASVMDGLAYKQHEVTAVNKALSDVRNALAASSSWRSNAA